MRHLASWVHRPADPGHLALQKGLRVAIAAPLTFAFLLEVVGSGEAALFGAFGAFAFLGFADFGGAPWPRARAYLTLAAVGAALVGLGTLVSGHAWLAAGVMVVVGFTIRFAGFFGGSCNAAVSPAILSFVLGATVEGSASDIGPRAGGWVLAGVVATVLATVLWPRRPRLATRAAAGRACEALADAVEAFGDPAGPSPTQLAAVSSALAEVRRQATMPTRPAGPGAHDAALTLLVEQIERTGVLLGAQARAASATTPTARPVGARTLRFTVATLRVAARALLVADATPEPMVLVEERDALRDDEIAAVVARLRRGDDPSDAVRDLDATFIVRATGFLAVSIATNAAVLMGGEPPSEDDASIAPFIEAPRPGEVRRRLAATVRSQLTLASPWFQDSARAGIALGAAVLVALLTSVDHAFWVALGTLSVLRSNAFDTGRSAFQAAAGTAVGFAVAAAVLAVVGVDRAGLWIVMIVGFFCAAYFPVVLGFVAGQAAFTVLVVALFNLMVPEGWRTGLVRIEDIVIGVVVSVVVGLVFWPRRAEVGLRRVAADLYRCLGAAAAAPDVEHRKAVRACGRRAEAAYTQYLSETAAAPEGRRPWGLLLAAADTARNGLRLLEYDRTRMGDALCPETATVLDAAAAALGRDWEAIAEGIEDHGHPLPAPGDWITAADSTRGPVVSCLAAHADVDDAPAAVRAAFAREWLLALTQLTAPVAASVPALH